MPEKAEYWDLTSNQFKRLKEKLELIAYHVSRVCKKFGYTSFLTTRDWLGFTFTKKEMLQRFLVLELSNEDKQLFDLRIGVWLMKGKDVEKAWGQKFATELSIEKLEENNFQVFLSAIQRIDEITVEQLSVHKPM